MIVPRPFLIALQFLTVIPVHLTNQPTEREIGRSILYYPLIGLLIGFLITGVNSALTQIPDLLRAALILLLWITITGFLHLDGLADSADAWVGGRGNRDRTLAIMKDPQCGPAGVVMLIAILLIKFSALAEFESTDHKIGLIFIPVMGRTVLLPLFLTTPYVRQKGLGTHLVTYVPHQAALIVILFVVLSHILILKTIAITLIIAVVFIFVILRQIMINRIGGTTGDTAGALVELTEATILALLL
ncbi:MAG: adenosylcobinamide-GDP ribazoletransferase [Methylococcales bacterium]